MKGAFQEHEALITDLKQKEATLQAEQADIQRKKVKLAEKEAKLKKLQTVSEGTSHKLRIRKEELDKEWERIDQLRINVTEREAVIQKEKLAMQVEKELVNADKEEKIHLKFELKE